MASSRTDPGVVILDRDGVICENRPDYVKSWAEFSFVPGAIEAMAALARSGVRLFVVTNQSAVGRGLMSKRTLEQIHDRMLDVLSGVGARVDGIYVCPHHPQDDCVCRKPKPGLLRDLAKDHKVDLAASFLVGDNGTDIRAGAEVGCTTILVRTGLGERTVSDKSWGSAAPDFVADDLVDAAIWILARRAEGLGVRKARR